MIGPTVWQGSIKSGRVDWRDKEGIQRYIAGLEGKRVIITIQEHSSRRSLNQNAYAHVVFEYISEETGHEPDEVKEFMKRKFLSIPDRRGRLRVRGTSSLTKREFGEFLERVVCWSANWLGLAIPPPEQYGESWAA